MDIYTINYIKNNPLVYNYLREDSSWYKKLNRGNVELKKIEELAKKLYKKTPEDRLNKLSKNIDMIKYIYGKII